MVRFTDLHVEISTSSRTIQEPGVARASMFSIRWEGVKVPTGLEEKKG